MSDVTHGFEPTEPDGTLLLDRMNEAVSDVRPEVVSLVGGGIDAGRVALRRRRRQGWAAVAAAVAVVAAGSVYIASNDLRSDAPPVTEVGQTEPATPRGLAASVLRHLDDLGEPTLVGGWRTTQEAEGNDGIVAAVVYGNEDEGGIELQVYASADTAEMQGSLCEQTGESETCRESTLEDGTRVAVATQWSAAVPDVPEATFTMYLAVRDDQYVAAVQTAVGDQPSALTEDQLGAIATDPLVGVSTGSTLNEAGLEIEDFEKSSDVFLLGTGGEDSGSSSGGGSAGTATASPDASR